MFLKKYKKNTYRLRDLYESYELTHTDYVIRNELCTDYIIHESYELRNPYELFRMIHTDHVIRMSS